MKKLDPGFMACRAILQVVTLLFALGTFAIGQFHRFRIAIAVLLGVNAVLFIDAAQTFYFRELSLSLCTRGTQSSFAIKLSHTECT